ncbi:1-phosphofructokinase [Antrihabitans sp. YC2-6]|uniref:1-phosphofructokinase n=1 Tax=Antrihabitans sp. YC2-6 TaxID=2799498 RepID=UPI0018F67A3E|nr:1-phosphofructokinase [Antrihabitans sp. YC2-6]MBJ8345028.1 1-phosphofructokinase [Antrihabitans sp. YC2-6]
MIVTLTANPSIDRTIMLAATLERGAVQRARAATSDPGGKGINVARVVAAAGVPAIAALPGNASDPLLVALRDAGIAHRTVAVPGNARTNLTLAEPDGTTTKINALGNPLTSTDADHLAALVHELATDAAWVVLSGSLPPGVPDGWYADLVEALRQTPARVAVDTSDGPLTALAARFPSAAPDLIKPNAEELAQLTGHSAVDLEAAAAAGDTSHVVAAARSLIERGVGSVLATLGGAGAVLVTDAGAWHATVPPIRVRSTVGAGDSSLAGYLLADLRGAGPDQRLAAAVAYGAAAASLPGTVLPTADNVDIAAATVTNLQPTHTIFG